MITVIFALSILISCPEKRDNCIVAHFRTKDIRQEKMTLEKFDSIKIDYDGWDIVSPQREGFIRVQKGDTVRIYHIRFSK